MLPLLGAVNIFSFPRVTSTGRLAARGGGGGGGDKAGGVSAGQWWIKVMHFL